MNLQQAIATKFDNVPETAEAAREAILAYPCKGCVVCGSRLVLSVVRVVGVYVHCNHCGSEVPFAAVLNQEAWQITAKL